MIQAGFAEIDITPRLPVRMDGYAARTKPADGVLDPIRARACVIDDSLAIVALDWCWIPTGFTQRVRESAAVPHTLVAATHTHSGPAPSGIASRISRLIREARRSARPCDPRFGHAPVQGIGANRRHRGGPSDAEVRVLSFGNNVIVNHGCHLTTLGAGSRKLSADFFGLAAERFPGITLCTNSACGDVSSRFTRRAQTYAEVKRFAAIFADAILRALDASRSFDPHPLMVRSRTVSLKGRKPPAADVAARNLEVAEHLLARARARAVSPGTLRQHITRVEAAQELLARVRNGHVVPPCEIQTIRLGEKNLLAVPLELLAGTGRRLLRRHDMVVCYANGYSGYLVPDTNDDYEAMISGIAPDQHRRFMNLVR